MGRRPEFSPEPLLDFAVRYYEDLTLQEIADALEVSYRTLMRWAHEGHMLTAFRADQFATKLGRHPSELWDEWNKEGEVTT